MKLTDSKTEGEERGSESVRRGGEVISSVLTGKGGDKGSATDEGVKGSATFGGATG